MRPNLLTAVMVLTAALACGLRLARLDSKVYWHDEAFTSLRASGSTGRDMETRLFDGHRATLDEVREFQSVRSNKNIAATLHSLAIEDSEHPPLYFVLARLWMRIAGERPAEMRLLSAIFGIGAVPLMWWLSIELFRSRLTALIAALLMSVSPFFVQYSQEARPYSLWTAMLLLSCAWFVRALRTDSRSAWLFYSLSSAVALYVHFLTVLVLAAQAVHIGFTRMLDGKSIPRRFVAAVLGVAAAFAPWALVMAADFERSHAANSWMRVRAPFSYLVDSWVGIAASLFGPAPPPGTPPSLIQWTLLALGLGSLILLAASRARTARLPLVLAVMGAAALILPDLLVSGGRSTLGRYLIPCLIAIVLAVSHTIGMALESVSLTRRLTGALVAGALVVGAGVTSLNACLADTWKRDDGARVTWEVVRQINAADRPVVLFIEPWPTNVGDSLGLSHALDAKVTIQFAPSIDVAEHLTHSGFVFNPTDAQRKRLEDGTGLRLEHRTAVLWQFVR